MPQVTNGPEIALVALGANMPSQLGAPHITVARAIAMLSARFGDVVASDLMQSPAFPAGSGPDYVNAAVRFTTGLDAPAVLDALHAVEADFGRVRGARWSARVIDLDLLALGGNVAPDLEGFQQWRSLPLEQQMTEVPSGLILPHPRLQDRAFVLKPLAQIASDWRHPVLGQTVSQMLTGLPPADRDAVVPFVQP